jgi:uncharacterized protein (DUF1684 family)
VLNRAAIREVNKRLRKQDTSTAWPINGRFNVTERAIRRVRRLRQAGLAFYDMYQYWRAVDDERKVIVNDSRNLPGLSRWRSW